MQRRNFISSILALLGFGLVEKESIASPTKEKAPKWREELESESRESYITRQKNMSKAINILKKYGNISDSEAWYVYKAICKRWTGYEIKYKSYKDAFIQSKWDSSLPLLSTINRAHIWDAICVTFRTQGKEDGFALIDCEFPKDLEEIEKYKDIAHFKRISIPLVRRIYPELL